MSYDPLYKYKPGECPEFTPKFGYGHEGGFPEKHQCPCGGITTTCANCGGDYHENPEEKAKCHLLK